MIALASDHGGYALKEKVKAHLDELGLSYKDFGTYSEESCDYPDFAEEAAKAVAAGTCDRGIVICTTGIGVSIVANKVKGIRCGLCTGVTQARLTREHNDANMLAIGAGITGTNAAMDIVDTFLNTKFSGLEKHVRRIGKITKMEE
ncbi:MAG: ribose 5-phosphate isomerase B [Lachnospiraceae bacterium]|jgi:ribose 5-phosphate isomerase B|nr:ribose 5-phosphate isomerase B [Lachnospiraceae bacterium]